MTARRTVLSLFAVAVVAMPLAAFAAKDPVAGTDYELIDPPAPPKSDKIEVVEAFSYGCIHCFHAAPAVSAWRKTLPATVHFEYLPAAFRQDFAMLARAYYTAESLAPDVIEKSHDDFFKAIFVDRKPMASLEDIGNFYAAYGIKSDTFKLSTHGFVVEARLKRADDLFRSYGINGTPTFVINGKYRVQAKAGGTPEEMLETVDALIRKESVAAKK